MNYLMFAATEAPTTWQDVAVYAIIGTVIVLGFFFYRNE